MKKILLTTSALTLLAGAAAAESSVNLNGYARIGISNSISLGLSDSARHIIAPDVDIDDPVYVVAENFIPRFLWHAFFLPGPPKCTKRGSMV